MNLKEIVTRRYEWGVLAAIFVTALALRLFNLGDYPLWGDELDSISGAQRSIAEMFAGCTGLICNQPPVHYLLLWLTMQPLDPAVSAFLVRLPSALAGALLPLVVYGLGKELFGRAQGLVAALLTAFSTTALVYSQDLRPYSMLVFFPALALYALLVAQRTGRAGWWATFALCTVAAFASSFHALTVFLPVFSLYLAYVLWQLWKGRSEQPRNFLYALIALGFVALGASITAYYAFQAPRISPSLSNLDVRGMLFSVVELAMWFTQFGIGGQVERLLQLAILLVALFGAYRAYKSGYGRGALLCLLFLVLPAVELAVLSTSYVVFQRYAIFALPMYMLLVSAGLVGLVEGARRVAPLSWGGKVTRGFAAGVAGLVIAIFGIGAVLFSTPQGHNALAYRPDFRGVAQHLSQRAQGNDIIVFLDDPNLGYMISNFYWDWQPPVAAYDGRDPRLFAAYKGGDIYWVAGSDNGEIMSRLEGDLAGTGTGNTWTSVGRFNGAFVLQERSPGTGIIAAMDRMVSRLEATAPEYAPYRVLRGGVQQAQGNLAMAAESYRLAGTYFPVGDEYQRTAEGYLRQGLRNKAWGEASIAKFWQPARPEIHLWISEKLAEEGYHDESRNAALIAQELQSAY